MGAYPELLLSEGRKAHLEARALLAKGIDPLEAKQQALVHAKEIRADGNSFFGVAKDGYKKRPKGVSERHANKSWRGSKRAAASQQPTPCASS